MLQEVGEFLGLKKRILVGYDLDDNLSQLSFAQAQDQEPQTLSLVAGAQQYSIPTLLAKRRGQDLWAYGHQAEKLLEEEDDCISIGNLLSLAVSGSRVEADGEEYAPEALLALFIRRTLSLIGADLAAGEIEVVVFTVRKLDAEMAEALDRVREYLQLPGADIRYLEYRQAFFEYSIHQDASLTKADVLLCDHDADRLYTNRLMFKKAPEKTLAWVEEEVYHHMGRDDEAFADMLEEELSKGECSSAYLIGKGFDGDWYQKGIKVLCRGRNRRVFSGNNLYSKGACYAAMESVHKKKRGSGIVYLGKDKLKSELGMKAVHNGKEIYYPLLRGGEDWFLAGGEHEFILETDNTLTLIISHLDHKPSREIEMILGGLPPRREKATRLSMKIELPSENEVAIHIEDLGFGEIFPATHKTWHESFTLD